MLDANTYAARGCVMRGFGTFTTRRLHLEPLVKPTSGFLFSCCKVNLSNDLWQTLASLFLSHAEAVF
jgi:hypothetical protein